MRILFAGGGTGGHLYPGIAIARALVKLDPNIVPVFVGAKRGIDREVLPRAGFKHLLLDLHPLYRDKPWENWRTIVGGLSAWREVSKLASGARPKVVVGTGGYAAGVALAWATLNRVPIVQHAGDSYPGITARWFAKYTREMYLGFPEAERFLSHKRATFLATGNPIDPPPEPRPDRAKARELWGFPPDGGKVLLFYGGSQGSVAMNKVMEDWIVSGLPDDLYIIWGTGTKNYPQHKKLESARVKVRGYLSPIADAYAAADFALARAGAMTTSELCAWGLPQILVPLPSAAADHQTYNAVALQKAGAAIHIPQRQFTLTTLDKTVTDLLDKPARLESLSAGARSRAKPAAADQIARRILALARAR